MDQDNDKLITVLQNPKASWIFRRLPAGVGVCWAPADVGPTSAPIGDCRWIDDGSRMRPRWDMPASFESRRDAVPTHYTSPERFTQLSTQPEIHIFWSPKERNGDLLRRWIILRMEASDGNKLKVECVVAGSADVAAPHRGPEENREDWRQRETTGTDTS